MITEAELPLHLPAPVVDPVDVERVCDYLRGKDWVKAAVLQAVLGLDDRKLRAIAEHSEGRILSAPGTPGYRYFDRSALPDAERAILSFGAQIRKMMTRRMAYQRRYHRFAHDHFPAGAVTANNMEAAPIDAGAPQAPAGNLSL